jgi:ATP-GRASP peptide maturase of grasp-with-spasm system
MILIVAEGTDLTCNEVIDCLLFNGVSFLRINTEDLLILDSVYISDKKIDFTINVNGQLFSWKDISFVWFRRGVLNFAKLIANSLFIDISDDLKQGIVCHLKCEKETLIEYLHRLLLTKPHINSPLTYNVNKLFCLKMARDCGLMIPETIICENKSKLKSHFTEYVTKSLSNVPFFHDLKTETNHTTLSNKVSYNEISNRFFISLFQEEIKKEFEVRSFVLFNKLYSMAIFSQQDEKTKIDYRNYNEKKPNRSVPINLPRSIEKKILKFMNKINLNCGSIDLIYSTNNYYVFLEVNPIGQFGGLSDYCCYDLEKIIAHKMMKYEKKHSLKSS